MHRYGLAIVLGLSVGLCACESAATPTTNPPANSTTSTNAAPLPEMAAVIKKLATLDGAQDLTAEMQLQVEDADGKRAQLAFQLQRKYTPEQTATFIKVTAPREESDKAILAIEKDGQPTEATSYLAGLKKLAKLKSNNQVSFREAKVTVQELLGMELQQYEYGKAERVNDNGQSLIKAEGKAKPNSNLAYPRILVFVGEAPYDPVKVELYDEKNELAKRATFDPLKEQQGKRLISRVVFEDLAAKRKSTIDTRGIKLDQNLSPKLFTEDNLKGTITSASQKLVQ